MPFFSVIIPSYNRAAVLPRAITSVLNQRFADWELLIVDDGSTDATQQQVVAFNDPRIQYVYQENKGVCAARNKGILLAKGNYICFLDSDDTVQVNWLQDFYQTILILPCDVVFCNATIHHLDGSQRIVYSKYPYHPKKQDSNGLYLAGIFAIENEFLDKLDGFDENIKFGEFTELSFRVRQHQPIVCFNDKNNLTYYINTSGGGKNNLNKIQSNIYLLQKHTWYFNQFPHAKRLYLQNIAVAYAKLKSWKEAQNYFWKAYCIQPWKFKTLARLGISIFPIIAKRIWK